VSAIADRLEQGMKKDKFLDSLDEAIADLAQREAARYEQGLTALGKALGANALKPAQDGRCDSAWIWGSALWVTFEAKSEEGASQPIPLRDLRQANTHLRQLTADQGVDAAPAGSCSIIVSHRATVDLDAADAANPNLHLASPEDVSALAADTREAWRTLLVTAAGTRAAGLRKQVAQVLADLACLPTQVFERLTSLPISHDVGLSAAGAPARRTKGAVPGYVVRLRPSACHTGLMRSCRLVLANNRQERLSGLGHLR
jgi:hypothetical protein